MFIWITKQIIISLLIIVLAHSIYMFLKTNLTTPKIRDLVEKPIKQYDKIYNKLENSENNKISLDEKNNDTNENQETMKSELQNYLKELSVTSNLTNKISTSDNFDNSFSPQFQNL